MKLSNLITKTQWNTTLPPNTHFSSIHQLSSLNSTLTAMFIASSDDLHY